MGYGQWAHIEQAIAILVCDVLERKHNKNVDGRPSRMNLIYDGSFVSLYASNHHNIYIHSLRQWIVGSWVASYHWSLGRQRGRERSNRMDIPMFSSACC